MTKSSKLPILILIVLQLILRDSSIVLEWITWYDSKYHPFCEKYIVKALQYLFVTSVRYRAHPSNNGRMLSVSRGNEIEIALSNAINYAGYRCNFCCHGSFTRGCVRKEERCDSGEIDGAPEKTCQTLRITNTSEW